MPTSAFNPEIDKITERELVYNFASRLRIGENFTNPDDTSEVIFKPPTKVKDIMRKTVMALPASIVNKLDDMHTAYVKVIANVTTEVSITLPSNAKLLLAYSERTLTDLSSLFVKSGNTYKMNIDIPYANSDVIKFYYTIA